MDTETTGGAQTCAFHDVPARHTMASPAVILENPRFPHNVGTIYRLCAGYLIPELYCTGSRIRTAVDGLGRIPREERMRGYRDVTLFAHDRPLDLLPEDVVPVAVEITPAAENLFDFLHPEHAVYVFGPEDGSLSGYLRSRCHRFVQIDVCHCLNLATAVATVLYDRAVKTHRLRAAL